MAQTLYFLINRGVLFNERISLRHISLRLVVVVVRNEIFDRIMGQQFTQLIRQLCGKSLILNHHQGGTLHRLNEPRRRGRLTGTGGTHEHNIFFAILHPLSQLRNGFRLIPGRFVLANNLKRGDDSVNFLRKTHIFILITAHTLVRAGSSRAHTPYHFPQSDINYINLTTEDSPRHVFTAPLTHTLVALQR